MVHHQFNLPKGKNKEFKSPSMTLPDEAISVQELHSAYLGGGSLIGNPQTPTYDPLGEGTDLRKLDFIDRQKLTDGTEETQQKANNHYKSLKKQETEKQVKLLVDETVKKLTADKGSEPTH